MSFANVDIGNSPSDGSGDSLRAAFNKINQNFANIAESRFDITVEAPVQSVAGRIGDVVLTVNDIPGATTAGYVDNKTEYAIATAKSYTDYQISTVSATVSNLIDSAPGALDTLNELAAALGDDSNFAANITVRLDGIESQIGTLESGSTESLDAEIAARLSGDSALAQDILDETDRATAAEETLQTNIDNEATARAGADTTLQNNIDTLSIDLTAADAALDLKVDNEIDDRTAADATLQDNIDAESQARIAADDALGARIDSVISNIDPAALDSLTEIVGAFQVADSNLNNAITALAGTASSDLQGEIDRATDAEQALQLDIDTLRSDLANVAITGSYNDLTDTPAAFDPTGLATETYVDSAIAAIPATDLTGLATETYVDTAVSNLVNGAGPALDTLNELAAALGNDENFATTVTNLVANVQANVDTLSDSLSTVATSGSYADLTNKPTIPSLGNFTLNSNNITAGWGNHIYVAINGEDAGDPPALINRAWRFSTDGSFQFIDPLDFPSPVKGTISPTTVTEWNTAYGWGDHSAVGYLTAYTETDPVFSAWDKSTGITITESQITDLQSYLTSYTETDPVVGAITGIVKSDGAGNITAAVAGTDYSTFDGAYSSLSDAPVLSTVATTGDYNDLLNKPSADTGNFTFSANTLGVSDANGGITINANGTGEIVMSDNVGIKNINPSFALHVGTSNNGLVVDPETIGVAVAFGNESGSITGEAALLWDWNDAAGNGSNQIDSTEHARFGIFKNGLISSPWLTFDRDAPANALAVIDSGELLILGTKAVRIVGVPASSTGQTGDTTGMIAHDANYYYYCVADYDGSTNIWRRVAWDGTTW